jgi:hypothetical protein
MCTCWPTRNLGCAIGMRSRFSFIRCHISRTIGHACWRHDSRTVNRLVIASYEFLEQVIKPVSVLMCEKFVQLIPDSAVSSGWPNIWHRGFYRSETIPSRFNMSWNVLFTNSFPLSVRTQTGRFRIGLEYLGSLKMVWNAVVTALPVFANSGTMCKNFEKITRYLTLVIFTETLYVHTSWILFKL